MDKKRYAKKRAKEKQLNSKEVGPVNSPTSPPLPTRPFAALPAPAKLPIPGAFIFPLASPMVLL